MLFDEIEKFNDYVDSVDIQKLVKEYVSAED